MHSALIAELHLWIKEVLYNDVHSLKRCDIGLKMMFLYFIIFFPSCFSVFFVVNSIYGAKMRFLYMTVQFKKILLDTD